jgi:beta-phosphoglucomutase-like phosphatase (HAD superfamily)
VIRAVVFDFDGVIANSEPLHFRAFRDVLAGYGLTLTLRDYYDRYLGYDDAGAFRAVANDQLVTMTEAVVADLVARKAVAFESLEIDGSVLFAGARAAIQRMAAACPIAIASGARRPEILRVLEHERLTPLFRFVVAAEDAPVSKPAPDPYLLAVSQLGAEAALPLAPGECVAVEDSRWGLESARAAGLKTVAVTHTYAASELSQADLVIDHLDRLTWQALNDLPLRNR